MEEYLTRTLKTEKFKKEERSKKRNKGNPQISGEEKKSLRIILQ